MPSWQTVAITLGASGIAVMGTLLGTWLQLRHARREQKAAAAAARRQRAAEILGRVRTLLQDLEPARIGANVNREWTPSEMNDLKRRWLPLRDELSVFAAADEDPRVTDAAGRLEAAVFNTHNQVSLHVRELLTRRGSGLDAYEQARKEHLRATVLVRIVLDLLRKRDVAELEARLQEIDARGIEGATES
jgi:hypothetical protein